jgi:hypothetical protein
MKRLLICAGLALCCAAIVGSARGYVKELEGDIKQRAKDLKDPSWPSRPAVTFDVCGTPFTLLI